LYLASTKFSKGLGYVHGIWNIIRGAMAIGGLVGAIVVNEKFQPEFLSNLIKLKIFTFSRSFFFFLEKSQIG